MIYDAYSKYLKALPHYPINISCCMIAQAEYLEDSEEESPLEDLRLTFARIQDALEADPFFASIRAHSLPKPVGGRQVTGRMRGKLLGWLEKLGLATFKFRRGTFITAALVLDQHLALHDDPPSALQLLGCAALLAASKLTEEVIVAPECYATASCHIFNTQQLLEKERAVFGGVQWEKVRLGALRGVRVGCGRLGLGERVGRAEEILGLVLKEERSTGWNTSKLIYTALSLTQMDHQHGLNNEELIDLVQQF